MLTKIHFPNGGLARRAAIVQANPETAPILGHPGPNGVFTWKGILNNALTGAIANMQIAVLLP
ncbi:MAG: hypothetical protein LUC93_03770 [Planctomycetaceae bacterium]|nr:hypothetical protein [Planctomycetaceae bacterium]